MVERLLHNEDGSYPWIRIVCGVLLLLVFVCSLTLNSLLLHVIRTRNMFSKKGNRFIGALLINELLIRIFGSPLVIVSILTGRWDFGDYGCVYYAFLMTTLGISSISLLSVIAVERFLAVCPKHRTFITRRTAMILVGVCVVHGLFWAVTPLCGWGEYVFEPSGLSCSPSWAPEHLTYIIVMLSTGFFVPLLCMGISYGTILWKVRTNNAGQQAPRISDLELSKTMVLIMVSFLFCWLPYMIIAAFGTFGVPLNIPPEVTLIPLICAKSGGMWHPLIYGVKNGELRRALLKTCKALVCRYNRVELDVVAAGRRVVENNEANCDFLGITTRPDIAVNGGMELIELPSKSNDNIQTISQSVHSYTDPEQGTVVNKKLSINLLDTSPDHSYALSKTHNNGIPARLQPRPATVAEFSV